MDLNNPPDYNQTSLHVRPLSNRKTKSRINTSTDLNKPPQRPQHIRSPVTAVPSHPGDPQGLSAEYRQWQGTGISLCRPGYAKCRHGVFGDWEMRPLHGCMAACARVSTWLYLPLAQIDHVGDLLIGVYPASRLGWCLCAVSQCSARLWKGRLSLSLMGSNTVIFKLMSIVYEDYENIVDIKSSYWCVY